MAKRLDPAPLLWGVRQRHAWRLINPRELHLVVELRLAAIRRAAHGGGRARLRRAAEGNMPLAGEQPACGIKANPTGPGKENLAPGVQIGEVALRTARSVEGLHVGREL